jgi:hypothetical protein
MGKKRSHAETKDGFSKPSRDKDRMNDKKAGDKKKNGESGKKGSNLVRGFIQSCSGDVANVSAGLQTAARMAYSRTPRATYDGEPSYS